MIPTADDLRRGIEERVEGLTLTVSTTICADVVHGPVVRSPNSDHEHRLYSYCGYRRDGAQWASAVASANPHNGSCQVHVSKQRFDRLEDAAADARVWMNATNAEACQGTAAEMRDPETGLGQMIGKLGLGAN